MTRSTTKRNGLPSAWVTHISALIAGENSCQFAAWMQAHYNVKKVERAFDLTTWKADHAGLVQQTADQLHADGWAVRLEDQNFWRWKGSAAILSGKPDIVGQKPNQVRTTDCKTGTPKDRDRIQVAIYCLAIPRVWQAPSLRVHGAVVYPDHTVYIEPEEAQAISDKVFWQMRAIGSPLRPAATPSVQECRFCNVSKQDCPDRIESEEVAEAVATEF